MSHSLCHILAAGIGEKIDGVGAVVYVKSFFTAEGMPASSRAFSQPETISSLR